MAKSSHATPQSPPPAAPANYEDALTELERLVSAMEGGQMPLKMRIPKRGFKNPFRVEAFPINVSTLEKSFDAGATVDLEALKAKSLVPKRVECVKILGEGDLTKKLTVKAHRFSETAKEKIAKAGGQAVSLDTAAAAA